MAKRITPETKKPNLKNSINLSSNISGKSTSFSGKITPENIEKVTSAMVDIMKRTRRIWRKEINDWQAARLMRNSPDIPRNYPLQEVYDDSMMDGHLTAVTENRTLRTINKNFIFAIDGKKDDKLSAYIDSKQWFETAIEEAHKSTFRGGIVLWVREFDKGEIKKIMPVPYGLVIPERNLIVNDLLSNTGFDFTDETLSDVLWFAQFYSQNGLLEKAAPFTILKRHSWGSWDEFEEMFGIPIRIAKIASQSEQVKNEVAGWLEEMGSAAYGVFPIGTEIDIKENSKADAFNVFFQKIKALDAELSKLVVHQTMTTDNGSSKAQGNVHEATLEEIIKADEKKMLAWLNDVVVPAMRRLGYSIPDGARIIVEQTKDPTKQISIDGVIMGNGYVLKQQYLEETYGIEIERMPSENAAKPTEAKKP